MLRPALPRIGRSLRSFRRSLHSVPPLVRDYRETGIPEFLSPEGFHIAWTEYQTLMVERLNALTSGRSIQHSALLQSFKWGASLSVDATHVQSLQYLYVFTN
jgi:superoxide dismutase